VICLVKFLIKTEYLYTFLLNFIFLLLEDGINIFSIKFFVRLNANFLKKKIWLNTVFNNFYFLDFFYFLFFFYFLYSFNIKKNYLNYTFYKNNFFRSMPFTFKKINFFFLGESFFFFKLFLISFFILIFITLTFMYIQLALEVLPLAKILFAWLSIFFFLYLLLSGFIFFLKRYNFSKFTTIISRFWKRSFNLFWLLEGFIFLCFIYLTFNSSSEVLYFYDYQSLFKTHLFSFRIFFFKLLLITAVILCIFFLLGSYNFLKPSIVSFYILIISSMVLYITWVEFIQFFHFINFCDYFTWNYNADSYEWVLENEFRKTRIVNNYILVCVVAKFWHLIIIVLIWFFSANRILENTDSHEYLLSANLQNFIILYLLNWISMYPWFKYILRKYLNITYLWFCSQFRERFFTNFFNGFYSLMISLV